MQSHSIDQANRRWQWRSAARRGGSAIEFALILAVSLIGVMVALSVLAPNVRRQFEMAFAGGGRQSIDIRSASVGGSSASQTHDTLPASEAEAALELHGHDYVAIGCAASILTLSGWTLSSRRRRARGDPSGERSAAPLEKAPLTIRALTKRQELWRALLTDGELLLKNGLEVRHLMTREPLCVSPGTSVSQVTRLMRESRVHHMLVSKGERLVGLVSDRDLCGCDQRPISEIMRTDLLTVGPHTSLGSAIEMLIEHHISCLPVVNDGRLCGLISTTDLTLTLQCSLQLWLRMAHSVRTGAAWVAELEGFSRTVRQEVGLQQERVARLRRLLHGVTADAVKPDERAFARQAEELIESSSRLATQMEEAQLRLNNYADRWIGLSDLRTDETTGLANRRELEAVIELLLAINKRYQQPFSLVVAGVGDALQANPKSRVAVLGKLVTLLAENMRSSDFVARLSESTFAVVLTQTHSAGAKVFCDRLHAAAQGCPTDAIAIGAARTLARSDDTPSLLLDRALAMLSQGAESDAEEPAAGRQGHEDEQLAGASAS